MEKLTGMTEREMIMINFLTRRSIERIIVVDRMRVHVDEDLDNEDVMAWIQLTQKRFDPQNLLFKQVKFSY